MSAKHWYWKFNVDAWLTDPGLSVVSLEAQGLWFRCLCLMFKNDERRGYLQHRGKQISADFLAKSCGSTASRVKKLLKELEDADVFSRDEYGVIFNRRMVRDEEIRRQAKENGRLGGNPSLVKGVNPSVNPLEPEGVNPSVTSSYVTNNSSSLKEGVQGEKAAKPPAFNPAEAELPKALDTPEFLVSWVEWCDYRRGSKKPLSQKACEKQLAKLAEFGVERAIAAINKSIQNDWQGLFPENVDVSARAGPAGGKRSVAEHNADVFDRVFGRKPNGNQPPGTNASGVLRLEEHSP